MSHYALKEKETVVVKEKSLERRGDGTCQFWALCREGSGTIMALFKSFEEAGRYVHGKRQQGENYKAELVDVALTLAD